MFATDRPMYRPGEVVRIRSLTLERFSLQPAAEELNLRFRITGPAGELCRVFIQRMSWDETGDLAAEGDGAVAALEVARAFL